jgi:hypothetical protein
MKLVDTKNDEYLHHKMAQPTALSLSNPETRKKNELLYQNENCHKFEIAMPFSIFYILVL